MPTRRSDPPTFTPEGRLDEAPLQQVLGYQLAQASIVTDAVFHQEVGEPLQLRRVEYTVLMLVAQNPGGSAARIARALAVTPPNVTVILDRLESRKLVQRQASTEDRRSQQISVTRAGDELLRKATGRIVAAERRVMGLSAGEQAILVELLHKVACRRDAVAGMPRGSARGGGA